MSSSREALPDVREWSECPLGCPGVVGRPSRMCGSDSRMSGVVGRPSQMCEVVGRPSRMCGCASRMSENGWETLSDVREWSRGPPRC